MDERSVEWLCLLPADSRLVVRGAPPSLGELLSHRIGSTPNAFVGWNLARRELPTAEQYDSVVLINPRGVGGKEIAELGFRCTLGLCALPSLADTRVFAPLANRRIATSALDLFSVYRPLARIKHAVAKQIARVGQLQLVGDRVVVGRRRESDIERWLRDTTGLTDLHLAISPGGISNKRKLTIQTMSADGRVVGFSKLAISPAAIEATRRESAWLAELSRHPELNASIPRLIAHASLPTGFATLLSPGPRAPASQDFGPAHRNFLESLAAATGCMRPFEQSRMWKNLYDVSHALESRLSADWRSRFAVTLDQLRTVFGGRQLPMLLAHRDFQPGNMRRSSDGRLFVYDWEGAQPESTPLYDFFNFNVLRIIRPGVPRSEIVARVLNLAHEWFPNTDRHLVPAYLTAYVLDHSLRRLTNSDFARDTRSIFVVDTFADLLDSQAEWGVVPA